MNELNHFYNLYSIKTQISHVLLHSHHYTRINWIIISAHFFIPASETMKTCQSKVGAQGKKMSPSYTDPTNVEK